jgi:DNA sulfur modification protein DndC
MEITKSTSRGSAFEALGLRKTVEGHIAEIQKLYAEDQIPWVVGYSGGKDSTATLQLVWLAIAQLPEEARKKPVFVITTDTLVENPVVSAWVVNSLQTMEQAAMKSGVPIYPHRLTPDVRDTFWVNLIGKGYPAPRPKFRWCTERLKIKPADGFISNVVRQNGEAIVVLGTRKAESSGRAARLNLLESKRPRDHLTQHSSLLNAYVYAPIAEWTNDDVWLFLMQARNPWGYDNKDLLTLYQGASPDAECPLVIDTSTPSCGDSRFGCWVCTLVEQDKSMTAMIKNDDDKAWMEPLLALRNDLDEHDHDKRDFRRMSGAVMLIRDKDDPIPGPYTQKSREMWLRRLLEAQQAVRTNPLTPEAVRDIELITMEELHEVRRIWVVEKYEIEDALPMIYEEVTGTAFPGRPLDGTQPFGRAEMDILREVSGGDPLQFELLRELLEVERQYRGMAKRARLFDRLESALKKSFFEDAADASSRARMRRDLDTLVERARSPELALETTSTVKEVLHQLKPATKGSPASKL